MSGVVLYTDTHLVPFLVDEDDVDAVTRYSWAMSHGYPVTTMGKHPTSRKLTLHLFLMGPAPDGMEWDHRDRNKRNNQRANLRSVTNAGNKHNVGPKKNNKSGVTGVRAHRPWGRNGCGPTDGRWSARIKCGPVEKHLGIFNTIEEAAAARRAAELALWAEVER